MTTMTDPDPTREFLAALPDHIRRGFTISPMRHVPMIHAAIRKGWTPQGLAAECARGNGPEVLNPGGLVTYRLIECANGKPPPAAAGPVGKKFAQPKPPCGDEECDPITRWRTDLNTGQITGRCGCWTNPRTA